MPAATSTCSARRAAECWGLKQSCLIVFVMQGQPTCSQNPARNLVIPGHTDQQNAILSVPCMLGAGRMAHMVPYHQGGPWVCWGCPSTGPLCRCSPSCIILRSLHQRRKAIAARLHWQHCALMLTHTQKDPR